MSFFGLKPQIKTTYFEEDNSKCNYLKCLAGMVLAGSGKCFLGGNAKNKNCK